ncbi:amiloride-sensitive sodium channel subunit delta [Ambystoma mexicanum]|uniref:amiloride-sensitive sodium channel subunit delta n=1 Tax=Ambystoma mexicanum TaxID=8296 RepID=UPI0037E8C3A7
MAKAEAEQQEGLIEFYDSFMDMFQFFCNNTTIHGSIRLACTSRNKMKTTFWAVLYVSSFGMFYWQMSLLTAQYWSYPVTLNVNTSTNAKVRSFPAVTVCNLNPYRFDVVNENLIQLDLLTQKTLASFYGFEATKSVHGEPQVTALEDILEESRGHFNNSFQLEPHIKLERLTDDGSRPATRGHHGSRVGFQLCDTRGGDCYYKSYWSGVDALQEWYLFHFLNIMSRIPITINMADKKNTTSFVHDCQYNGRRCSKSEYVKFHHAVHGSCYTFNNNGSIAFWKAATPGVKYGLSLIVRADQNVHLPLLSSTVGARVMIHNRDQSPTMEHGGFDVRPGTETSINIQKNQMNWLGGSYGRCSEDGKDVDIKLLNSDSYTVQACLHSCFQEEMLQHCGCGYYFHPLPPGAEHCNYNKHPGWGHCFFKLQDMFMEHKLGCFARCPKSCQETWYTLSAGTAQWPRPLSEELTLRLLHLKCKYNGTSGRKELSRINIFFQEISQVETNEVAIMTVEKLLSDMGSLWGLWFGSSALSAAEVIELILDTVAMCLILANKRWNQDRLEASTCTSEGSYTTEITEDRKPNEEDAEESRAMTQNRGGITFDPTACRCHTRVAAESLPDILPTGTRLRRNPFAERDLGDGLNECAWTVDHAPHSRDVS